MSASGTKRTCGGLPANVRFRGQTGHSPSDRLMSAFDPKRTESIGFAGFSFVRENAVLLKSLRLFTIVMVALCLVPAGAHFFELTNKMSLSPVAYMTVQKIYAGWAFFGIPIITALLLTSLHAFTV